MQAVKGFIEIGFSVYPENRFYFFEKVHAQGTHSNIDDDIIKSSRNKTDEFSKGGTEKCTEQF